MTHEEAMNDDFQVPNGFLPSDKKQSTMTHNTQGGIARREKALEILNKNIGAEVLGTFGETDTQWIIDAMIEFKELDESPLPASPEGTEAESRKYFPLDERLKKIDAIADTVEFEYCRKYDMALQLAEAEAEKLTEDLRDTNLQMEYYQHELSKRHSTIEKLKQENERLKEELEDSITFSKKAIEIATDEMAKLKSQLAEAREALEKLRPRNE